MTRKTDGPKNPKTGAGKHGSTTGKDDPDKNDKSPDKSLAKSPGTAKRNGGDIVSLTSSPAFDVWLDLQTKKLVQASTTRPNEALLDLIRSWPANDPRKRSEKITD